MKTILILLDGVGDRSYEILGHRTPLQAANTPNLDRLARMGGNGLFHPTRPGQCLPSETAHYLLWGYDLKTFPGRGLLEAVGQGIGFQDQDVLCLALLLGVTWRAGVPVLTHKRDDIEGDREELGRLYAAVTPYEAQGIGFSLHHTRRNDAVLVLSGEASPHVSDADPMVLGRPMARVQPLVPNPEPDKAKRTARALNEYLSYAHKVLSHHEINRRRSARNAAPANFLATQRCGRRISQRTFEELWGFRGMVISSGAIYAGLARELGLSHKRMHDGPDCGRDLQERIRVALADPSHDFIHIHTKVPDEASHRGVPEKKRDAITALDRGLGELVGAVERRDAILVVVTADHSTPCISSLIHSGEPVPLTMAGPSIRRDTISSFDEVSAAGGCLGLLRGRELMFFILNCADRSSLLGHRLGSEERHYFPDEYESFELTE